MKSKLFNEYTQNSMITSKCVEGLEELKYVESSCYDSVWMKDRYLVYLSPCTQEHVFDLYITPYHKDDTSTTASSLFKKHSTS